jgi:hypothetical protein
MPLDVIPLLPTHRPWKFSALHRGAAMRVLADTDHVEPLSRRPVADGHGENSATTAPGHFIPPAIAEIGNDPDALSRLEASASGGEGRGIFSTAAREADVTPGNPTYKFPGHPAGLTPRCWPRCLKAGVSKRVSSRFTACA